MSDKKFHLPFDQTALETMVIQLTKLDGYLTGRASATQNSDEKNMLHSFKLVPNFFLELLTTANKISKSDEEAENIKKDFVKEITKVLTETEDSSDLPGKIGKILEDYDIISRKPESEDDDLPF